MIGLYLEGSSGAAGLVDVLQTGAGRKPVVLLVGGQSDQGAAAVVSHTGSLTPASRGCGRRSASSTRARRVHTLEQFLAALDVPAALVRYRGEDHGRDAGSRARRRARRRRVGARHRRVRPCRPRARRRRRRRCATELEAMGLGAGTSVANPLEIPFGPGGTGGRAPEASSRPSSLASRSPTSSSTSTSRRTTATGPRGCGRSRRSSAISPSAPIGDARIGVVLRNLGVVTPADARPDRLRRRTTSGSSPSPTSTRPRSRIGAALPASRTARATRPRDPEDP